MTVLVSLMTPPKPLHELKNLVWGATDKPKEEAPVWWRRPGVLAVIVAVLCIALNFWFR